MRTGEYWLATNIGLVSFDPTSAVRKFSVFRRDLNGDGKIDAVIGGSQYAVSYGLAVFISNGNTPSRKSGTFLHTKGGASNFVPDHFCAS